MRSKKMQPVLILAATALIVLVLVLVRRKPEEHPPPRLAPLVRVTVAEPTGHRFFVTAHGSVSPRTESDLVPQVSGEVLWIAPSLAAGGFFEKGDVLARIDTADYKVEREAARAAVARAESEYRRAKKELDRQRSLADRSVASQSRIDDAENAFRVAEAGLREARARLERADRDLARTNLTAPYRGRVRSKQVDVGQFVTRGTPIARVFAVDYAEVRLPIPDRDLAFLDVPLIPVLWNEDEKRNAGEAGSPVHLSAEFAGGIHRWEGTLVRTEAELDPRSRMVHLVARISDPYGLEPILGGRRKSGDPSALGSESDTPPEEETGIDHDEGGATDRSDTRRASEEVPLSVGLFVKAEIEGRRVDHAFVLPRDALRGDGLVYVIDPEDRLRFRTVEVLRTERDRFVVGDGLEAGDRVCTSPLQAVLDGMQVRVIEDARNESDGSLAMRSSDRLDETRETLP
ncbi:MAG TPA: efflux RND transporter periplasmic adaptor subunit [Deltaproteobacteria bacterium]|nr:efflux RND transporter periplasmic adaptor subunit [Deltaproteobacteria bacterium]